MPSRVSVTVWLSSRNACDSSSPIDASSSITSTHIGPEPSEPAPQRLEHAAHHRKAATEVPAAKDAHAIPEARRFVFLRLRRSRESVRNGLGKFLEYIRIDRAADRGQNQEIAEAADRFRRLHRFHAGLKIGAAAADG